MVENHILRMSPKNGEMPKELKDISCAWSEGEPGIQSYAKYLPE